MKKLWIKFLIFLGLRSQCCGAKFEDFGYKYDYCTECGKKK
jgi:hypothetical protein